jgi:glutamate/tyrosine decarboxylase-like PLP-dependent enzyme
MAASVSVLQRAVDLATRFLDELPHRPVGPPVDLAGLRDALGGPLPDGGEDPVQVIDTLSRSADPGLVAQPGPRYFGFVVGGSLPVALAADWLTSAWDQNAAFYVMSPAAAVAEEIAGVWLADLLGLPANASVGFTTGATMASFTALAAARHAVLERVGWNVERDGLAGSPPITVVMGEETHVTVSAALRLLGIGDRQIRRIPCDGQGRVRAAAVREALGETAGPTIVCAQAGNVNTGAFDPFAAIAEAARAQGAWLHIDGAFGLWAAAVPGLRHLAHGVEQADSWTIDGHKWLNVPYDCGMVFVRDRAAHQAAMTLGAEYYVEAVGTERDGYQWVPESSRRARGFVIWAALRSLGRAGVVELVTRCCALARQLADHLRDVPRVAVLNEVVLNQVLLRFDPPAGGDVDAYTREVISRVQREGTCWVGGTTWHGLAAMRVSVSNWSTTPADIDRAAAAIRRIVETY